MLNLIYEILGAEGYRIKLLIFLADGTMWQCYLLPRGNSLYSIASWPFFTPTPIVIASRCILYIASWRFCSLPLGICPLYCLMATLHMIGLLAICTLPKSNFLQWFLHGNSLHCLMAIISIAYSTF